MAWSIFTQGGGQGAALTWARDLLKSIGAPLSLGNQQMVYDWEVSEGGGGKYNPLNQGPVPGHPELTTTGQQFGGGAADFASWQAGLQGAADYLNMPAYSAVLANLKAGRPNDAKLALWASPWASSHYGYGSRWSNAALPGRASVLPITPVSGSGSGGGGTGLDLNPIGALTNAATGIVKEVALVGPLILAGAGLIVLGLVKATGLKQKATTAAAAAAPVAEMAAA